MPFYKRRGYGRRLRFGRRRNLFRWRTRRNRWMRRSRNYRARIPRRLIPRLETKMTDYSVSVVCSKGDSPDGSGTTGATPAGVISVGGTPQTRVKNLIQVGQDLTISGRVGNRVAGRYVRIAGACTAGTRIADHTQLEATVYVRTSFQIVVVEDLMTNNSTNNIDYGDVFDTIVGNNATANLRTDNLGRFRVVSRLKFDCDADDPVRSWELRLPYKRNIRYNGTALSALQDRGLYLLVGYQCYGIAAANVVDAPGYSFTKRFTYTDA